jgi:hypothetical protein
MSLVIDGTPIPKTSSTNIFTKIYAETYSEI